VSERCRDRATGGFQLSGIVLRP